MTRTIGTCSICGGPVVEHVVQYSTVPIPPSCQRCGAVKADTFGPIIEMERYKQPKPVSVDGDGRIWFVVD